MVFLNGFFVVAEYGLVRSRRAKLEELAEAGEGGASLALKMLDKQETYVSAVQLGITASTVLLGILGGRFFAWEKPAIGSSQKSPLLRGGFRWWMGIEFSCT